MKALSPPVAPVALTALFALPACGDRYDGGSAQIAHDSEVEDEVPEVPPPSTQAQALRLTAALHPVHENLVVVTWEQLVPGEVWVEYSFDDGDWRQTPRFTVEAGPQEQLLLGIPYDARTTWRLMNDLGEGPLASPDARIHTAPLPDGVPLADVLLSDVDGYDPDYPYVFTAIANLTGGYGRTWSFVIDRQARVVWARASKAGRTHMHPHPSYDGRSLLIDQNSFWGVFDGGAASTVERVKIDGTVIEEWATPGLHHPFTELPDGSLAWGAFQNGWQGDETLEILRPDGSQDRLWSCYAWFTLTGDPEARDCGSNTLRYDLLTDTFLFSHYTVESIVEIDATTGESLRWFGHIAGSWAFDPPDSAFWYQHGAYLTDDRTMVLSTHDRDQARELVVREYRLDEEAETLVEVWNFGVGDGVLGPQMGEVTLLPSGNVHHNFGELPRIREGTHDGRIVWDVQWRQQGNLARSTPLSDLYALAPAR